MITFYDLYFIDVFLSFRVILIVCALASSLTMLFMIIIFLAELFGERDEQVLVEIKGFIKWSFIFLLLIGLISIFIPSKNTMYSMVCLKAAPEIKQSDEYKLVINYIKSEINKNQEKK